MHTLSLPTMPESPANSLDQLHAHFLAILPRIQTHAKIHFRHQRCPGRREDCVAEVVAVCWKWFLRIAERGKDVDEFVATFADYAVRRVRSGRRLCGQERSKEVLSHHAQRAGGFRVEPLPPTTWGDRGRGHADAFEDRLRDNTRSPVPEQAAFRIEFPLWLAQLGPRNGEIARDMAMDLGTGELAARHGLSPGRISQLRREFHADWRRSCGDLAC